MPSEPSEPSGATGSSESSAPSGPSEPAYDRIVPKLPEPRTLEPDDKETTPWIRKGQGELWNDLRKFANDVKLTDEQWKRFERDLLELGAMNAHGTSSAIRAPTVCSSSPRSSMPS
jgi:hypothetical protein